MAISATVTTSASVQTKNRRPKHHRQAAKHQKCIFIHYQKKLYDIGLWANGGFRAALDGLGSPWDVSGNCGVRLWKAGMASTVRVKKVSVFSPILTAPAKAVGQRSQTTAIARVYINKVANGRRDKHYSRKSCVNDGKVLLLRPNSKERKV